MTYIAALAVAYGGIAISHRHYRAAALASLVVMILFARAWLADKLGSISKEKDQ